MSIDPSLLEGLFDIAQGIRKELKTMNGLLAQMVEKQASAPSFPQSDESFRPRREPSGRPPGRPPRKFDGPSKFQDKPERTRVYQNDAPPKRSAPRRSEAASSETAGSGFKKRSGPPPKKGGRPSSPRRFK